jgi:Tfp pilus tip-associated adhesin PilY1
VVGDADTDGDGIYNDGYGDYSIITTRNNSWIQCAVEGEECTVPEAAQVRYGVDNSVNGINDGTYTAPQAMTGTFTCNNDTFGDPLIGAAKVCEYSDNNGLSQPATIDIDADGIIDRIYAGDLHGNMWVFDVSEEGVRTDLNESHKNGAASWKVHANAEEPFFTACGAALNEYGVCPTADRQPITTTPLITNNPIQTKDATEPNHLVFFGTGQYLTDADESTTNDQSFYAIWDAGTISSGLTSADLTHKTINPTDANGNRTIVNSSVNYSSGSQYGWYYTRLPESRERVVLNPILFGNTLLFQTLIPTRGTCNATAGNGFIMAVDPLTGNNPDADLFGKVDGVNVAGIKISSVVVGSSLTKTGDDTKLNVKTADGKVREVSVTGSLNDIDSTTAGQLNKRKGRKSWSILK